MDLLILLAAHTGVDFARGITSFSGIPALLLAGLLPRGTFPRFEVVVAILLGLAIFGAYRTGGRWHRSGKIFAGSTLGLSLVFWSRIWEGVHPGAVVGFTLLLAAVGTSLFAGRLLLSVVVERFYRAPPAASRAVIIGTRERATALRQSRAFHSKAHVIVAGYLTTDRTLDAESLGALSDLVWIVERHNIDTIIIDDHMDDDALLDVLEVADRVGCTILAGSAALPVSGFVPRVLYHRHVPYVSIVRPRLHWAQLTSKRVFDVIASVLLLVLLAPVFAAVALVVALSSPGPIFYKSLRVGYGGRPFGMYKFRSMVQNAEALKSDLASRSVYSDPRLFKVINDPRVTRLGRFLRRSSLDELPQIWNVLRGDMSLVGPRPPLATEVALYEEHNYSRFDMKPGVTGPWQVSGRNKVTTFDEIIALETTYLTDWSLGRDLAILLRTVPAVLSMRGAV